MKPQTKKRLIAWLSLTAATVLIVEFNKFMKRQAPSCENGTCPLPRDHGLHINPFPDEIVPQDVATNELYEGAE